MCGRFTLAIDAEALAEAFGLDGSFAWTPRYNVAPSQTLLALRRANGSRQPIALRWGFVPTWSKDPASGPRPINARSETALAKPTFRDALAKGRCLVLADGFYEWRRLASKKEPYHLRLKSGAAFAMAGLYAHSVASDGTPLLSGVLLTTRANALVADIHDRMPAILSPDAYEAWLDPSVGAAEALALVAPYPAEQMIAQALGPWVNSVSHDDARCLMPLASAPADRQLSLFDPGSLDR